LLPEQLANVSDAVSQSHDATAHVLGESSLKSTTSQDT